MNPTNNKILVRVNPDQKDSVSIGGIVFKTALQFETNYREKSPTIAEVVSGGEYLRQGDTIICHHNLFYLPSPYHISGDIFSVPASKVLFAKIDKNGEIYPIFGNVICERIGDDSIFAIPGDKKITNPCVYNILIPGWTTYKKGDTILTRPYSGYDIVYNINGKEKRITKVDSEMICGVIKQ